MANIHFTHSSIVPVRSSPDDRSEIVTQWLFGELVDEIDRDKQWVKGRSRADGYEGWFDEKMTKVVDDDWLDGIAEWKLNTTVAMPVVTSTPEEVYITWLTLGSFLPVMKGSEDEEIQLVDVGDMQFQIHVEDDGLEEAESHPAITIAEMFVGAPYLWGGRSVWGVDCSGLTQLAMRAGGIEINRDASQQIQGGEDVEFADRQPTDLVFFSNKEGKVAHVGILDDDLDIIHAYGRVRRDRLVPEGIQNASSGAITHDFVAIKRYIQHKS